MSSGLRLLRGTTSQHTSNSSFLKNGEITAVVTANGVCTGEIRIHNENVLGGIPVGNIALTQSVLEGGRITHLREGRSVTDLGSISTRGTLTPEIGVDQLVIPANNVGIFKSDESTAILQEANTVVTLKNLTIDLSNDTGAIIVPKGTTAQRPTTAVPGMLRYNTELDQYELYNEGLSAWEKLGDQPPTISSVSPKSVETVAGTTQFTITGSGFEQTGMTTRFVSIIDGTEVNRTSFIFDTINQIRIGFDNTTFNAAKEPYNLVITKSSGSSATLTNALYVDEAPVWTITNNTNLANVFAQSTSAVNIPVPTATDPEGDVVTYSGSNFPTGLSINSTSGVISGSVPTANTQVEYTLTLNALSTGSDPGVPQKVTTRQPKIIVKPIIENSLMFDGSSYLSKSQTAGNRTTMTYSLWVKPSLTSSGHLLYDGNASNAESAIYFTSNKLQIEYYHGSSYSYYKRSANLLRDLSAWYHLVFVIDTSNSSAAHRFRIYINSIEVTNNDAFSAPSESLSMDFNENGSTVFIGARTSSTVNFNGYLADIYFVDGQALTPTSFGETINGVWIPKVYNPTGVAQTDYGTNGFHLTFASSTLNGTTVSDVSGRGNHWTASGF
tara:strand:+ start:818 stop:2653 length:1836 start_codon:yes stop_codon:yes gene_type:complete